MKKISRAEAQRQGLKRYFTGKPCKHGHISERYATGVCIECSVIQRTAWQEANRERSRQFVREWRIRNPEIPKAYYEAHKKEICERTSRYKRENRGKVNAWWAKRHLAKMQRTPPWADLEAIKAFYEACPEGYHVDHYYPLQGEICSGLHVLENLRHIPAKENISKGNKMPEVFYNLLA